MMGGFNAKKKFHMMEGRKREPRDEQRQEAPTILRVGDTAEVTRHKAGP